MEVLPVSFIILCTVLSIISRQFDRSCSRDYIQICENCKAASHCGGAKEETGITDINECKEMCRLNTTCNLAEYITNASKCVMYSCSDVEIDASSAVVRKACTPDCGRFTLKKKLKRVGSCEFLLTGCTLTETACASLCYDLKGCRSFSHNTSIDACNLHKCTSSVNRIVEEWNHTVRECLYTAQSTTPPSSSIDTPTCRQTIPDTVMPLMETYSEQSTVLTTSAAEVETTDFSLVSSAFQDTMTVKQLSSGKAKLHSTALHSRYLGHSLSRTVRSSRKPSTAVLDKTRKSLVYGTSIMTVSAAYYSITEAPRSSLLSHGAISMKSISYSRKAKLKCSSCKVRPSSLLIILLVAIQNSKKIIK